MTFFELGSMPLDGYAEESERVGAGGGYADAKHLGDAAGWNQQDSEI